MTKAGTAGCMRNIFDLYSIWLLISTVEHITHTHTTPDTRPLCTLRAGPSNITDPTQQNYLHSGQLGFQGGFLSYITRNLGPKGQKISQHTKAISLTKVKPRNVRISIFKICGDKYGQADSTPAH
jgi:hypothetical protein